MESLAGDFFHKIPETLNPLDIGVFMIQQITTQGARPSSRLSPIISTSNPLPLTHWAVPSTLSPAKPYRWWFVSIRVDCGLPSLDCRPSLGIKSGCGDPAEERRYTYTYRLTFWHIINTFLLLAGGNLRKNQIQHSQNTPVLCFWRTKQPGSPSPGWVCVNCQSIFYMPGIILNIYVHIHPNLISVSGKSGASACTVCLELLHHTDSCSSPPVSTIPTVDLGASCPLTFVLYSWSSCTSLQNNRTLREHGCAEDALSELLLQTLVCRQPMKNVISLLLISKLPPEGTL